MDRLVRIGLRFSKFCWSWSDPVPGFEIFLGSGPIRSQVSKIFLVLVRSQNLNFYSVLVLDF